MLSLAPILQGFACLLELFVIHVGLEAAERGVDTGELVRLIHGSFWEWFWCYLDADTLFSRV